MKRREMNALANSLCAYLSSRNNDIAGYWGIGILCAVAARQPKQKFSFKIRPGQVLSIGGYELSESKTITDRLVKHGLDSIEGRLSFFEDGHYSDGAKKYVCGIVVAVTQGGRTGLGILHVDCWSHDSSSERRRATSPGPSLMERLKNILR